MLIEPISKLPSGKKFPLIIFESVSRFSQFSGFRKMSNLTPYRKPDDLEDTLKKYSLEDLENELAKRKNLDLIEKYKNHITESLVASGHHYIYVFVEKFRFREYLRFGIVNDKRFENITEEIALIMGLKIYIKHYYKKYIKYSELTNKEKDHRTIIYMLNKYVSQSADIWIF